MIPIFDGHNDFLLRLVNAPGRREALWRTGTTEGHIDLPRLRQSGFAGGFFAVWVPSIEPEVIVPPPNSAATAGPLKRPLPPEVPYETAAAFAAKAIGQLRWMERQGGLKVVTSVAEIRDCMANGTIAAILHFEGAEAISQDLDTLDVWHSAGLRSLGPVWSRPTAFGHGVPFDFPSSPDTGPGLTEAGKALVKKCNALKIMLDLSHLNERGFWDVAEISTQPLVATHSNAHAITPASRNLTDQQLEAIAASDGMVGLNYATGFLAADGLQTPFAGWEPYYRHLDHLIEKIGEDRVGLGSDFDGATMSADMRDVMGNPRLLEALSAHGYSDELIEKLAYRNWLAVLERTWGG